MKKKTTKLFKAHHPTPVAHKTHHKKKVEPPEEPKIAEPELEMPAPPTPAPPVKNDKLTQKEWEAEVQKHVRPGTAIPDWLAAKAP